ncbi:MAG TPA: hypothetical protein PLV64_02870 [Anaerolineales bacterium]|nr:hypothetical protein [Anaerolineales bacterium]
MLQFTVQTATFYMMPVDSPISVEWAEGSLRAFGLLNRLQVSGMKLS